MNELIEQKVEFKIREFSLFVSPEIRFCLYYSLANFGFNFIYSKAISNFSFGVTEQSCYKSIFKFIRCLNKEEKDYMFSLDSINSNNFIAKYFRKNKKEKKFIMNYIISKTGVNNEN